MNVTYEFSSLESLADYLDNQALMHENHKSRTKLEDQNEKGAAYGFRSAARIVRASKLKSQQEVA